MSISDNRILIGVLIGWSILLGTYFSKFIELLSSNLISVNLISLIQIIGIIAMFFLSVLLTSYIVLKLKDENEGIAKKLTIGLSILYIAGFILAIIPTNNLTIFEYYTIIFFIISIISYLYLIGERYLFMNGDGIFKNFVFWAVIWSIMLGWYFFESMKFIAYGLSTSLIYSSPIIGFIFLILLASYFLSEIEDLDDEKLKRLSICITILYLIGDILATYVYLLIFIGTLVILLMLSVDIFLEIILIIIIILLIIVLIMIILNINILGILAAIIGFILNTNTLVGFLLMLTILVIQIIILLLTYNAYKEMPNEPPGF